jgi:hypothetical protein
MTEAPFLILPWRRCSLIQLVFELRLQSWLNGSVLKMKAGLSTVVAHSFLVAALASPSPGQNLPLQQSPLSESAAMAADNKCLQEELLWIREAMNQTANDMGAIDARMMLRLRGKDAIGIGPKTPKVHELLQAHDAAGTIQRFLNSPREIQWPLCLKTCKLYRGLLEEIFEMNKGLMSGDEKSRQMLMPNESLETAQLAFLARVIMDLELRYAELQTQVKSGPDVKRQEELWRSLREALENDDRTYLWKLKGLLAKTGASPLQFATKVVSDAQKTGHTAGAIVEGMRIVEAEGDVWKLAEIPGINPDFIHALECDRKAMKHFFATGSNAAFVQACSCRKYTDGSNILAFATPRSTAAKPGDSAENNQFNDPTRNPYVFRLPKEGELLNPQIGNPNAEADRRREGTRFGVTNSPVPRQKIPSWWIRCACPDDHPDAGLVVDGVRWHAPVLQCPNPELKLRELKRQP